MAGSLIIPTFEPESYFAGRLDAYGVFVDRFGTIQRQFEVVVEARAKPIPASSLDEYFLYDDGEREERRWDVTALGNGRYEGNALM